MDLESLIRIVVVFTVIHNSSFSDGACTIPRHFRGSWFSLQYGEDVTTKIDEEKLDSKVLEGVCEDVQPYNDTIGETGNYDIKLLISSDIEACRQCLYLFYRTPNVLQYKASSCKSGELTLEEMCSDILPFSSTVTMFNVYPNRINCNETFKGLYTFTYEHSRGDGLCDNKDNTITACQRVGSPYLDNKVFRMSVAKCTGVGAMFDGDVLLRCMGSWRDDQDNVMIAISEAGQTSQRKAYRCLLTRDDQAEVNKRYVMSSLAFCGGLRSLYEGDYRLVVHPVTNEELQMEECYGKWQEVINTQDVTNEEACKKLQESIDCLVERHKGCPKLVSEYVVPYMYRWAMTSDALQCDANYNQAPFEFKTQDVKTVAHCSFYSLAQCYKPMFDLMSIKPKSRGDGVNITNLAIWLQTGNLLLTEPDKFCSSYFGPFNFTNMIECGEELKASCQAHLPLGNLVPDGHPGKPDDDPYVMMRSVKFAADQLCSTECGNINKKQERADQCVPGDYQDIVNGVKVNGSDRNGCRKLADVNKCLVSEIDGCGFLVEKFQDWFSDEALEALKTCNISTNLNTPPPPRPPTSPTTGAPGVTFSITLLMSALLSAALCS